MKTPPACNTCSGRSASLPLSGAHALKKISGGYVDTTKLKNTRVIRIPEFRAVSSGMQTFEEILGKIFGGHSFDKWRAQHRNLIKDLIYTPSDFLWHEGAPETCGLG